MNAADQTERGRSAPAANPFRPGRALTVQVALALAVVLALAAWQFSRGLEKTALKNAHAERLRGAAVPAAEYGAETPDFTRLALVGQYDAEYTFIVAAVGNQTAFQVVSPFRTRDGVFLVNRGWVPRAQAASSKEIEVPAGPVEVVGAAWPREAASSWLGAQPWPEGWPKQVRGFNVQRMAAEVGAYAREIRLERGQPGVLRPASLARDYSPGTHWGYVGQWLLIGAALVVGYVVIGKRRGQRAVHHAEPETASRMVEGQ